LRRLVCAVYIKVEVARARELDRLDADFAELARRALGARDDGAEPMLVRLEHFDEMLGRRARPYAEREAVLQISERRLSGTAFVGIVAHGIHPPKKRVPATRRALPLRLKPVSASAAAWSTRLFSYACSFSCAFS